MKCVCKISDIEIGITAKKEKMPFQKSQITFPNNF